MGDLPYGEQAKESVALNWRSTNASKVVEEQIRLHSKFTKNLRSNKEAEMVEPPYRQNRLRSLNDTEDTVGCYEQVL